MSGIFKFCLLSHGKTISVKFANSIILSQEDAQQGDPLGPFLFCLAINPLIRTSQNPFKISYMDNVTFGEPAAIVAADVATIKSNGALQGLLLNDKKCEAILTSGHIASNDVLAQFIQFSLHELHFSEHLLLAAKRCLSKRCAEFEKAISRLELIKTHDALVLLRASFSAPMLQNMLRASPCHAHETLTKFDQLLWDGLCKICNIFLSED